MKNPGANIPHAKLRGEWAELRFMTRAAELGFRVAKPWGETAPYDVITDSAGHFLRVQVKCTIQKRWNSYRCNLAANHIPYTPQQVDFIAAYIIPEDTWYIIPLHAVRGTSLLFRRKKDHRPGLYDQYRQAWFLLRRPPSS